MTKSSAYLGHLDEKTGRAQLLRDHLTGVADLAGRFAAAFGEEEMGRLLGLYHDVGKYSREFQAYIRAGEEEKKKRRGSVDHSTAGAQEIAKLRQGAAAPLAFCIAGHHAGIPNRGERADPEGSATLLGRLKRKGLPDYRAYRTENDAPAAVPSALYAQVAAEAFPAMLYTRMLFSCLVDADFLDTEDFMAAGKVGREGFASLDTLLERLQKSLEEKFLKPKTEKEKQKRQLPINEKRSALLAQSIAAGKEAKGNLYRLTIPTGGGKTISSLAFALHYAAHAKRKRKRIIYVIPYTSIIEQNAAVFRELLGEENVVEHHQHVDYDDAQDTDMNRKRLATENWDAPVIVTTNVQFFESLFSNRPSKCRKLHNLAESIVIFDEAQMIPLDYLRPSLAAIEALVRHYACTAVLCTATQPPLGQFFSEDMQPLEICPALMENAAFFRRTKISLREGTMTEEELAEEMAAHAQVLCIVNVKKTAQHVFDLLEEEEGNYHLSTNLYPVHREQVLAEIRARLKDGKPCRVISTSLVEAGVDLDFPCVLREINGLDSIVQAAGRCNREGRRSAEESVVHVFSLEKLARNAQLAARLTKLVAREYGDDMANPLAIQRYFEELYDVSGPVRLDKEEIMDKIEEWAFADVAEKFRFIADKTKAVLVPRTEEARHLLGRIEQGERSRSLMRMAGRYMVQVYAGKPTTLFDRLAAQGKIRILDETVAVLDDVSWYDAQKGLKENISEGEGMFY
ncbi:CRISPR-associated helicase Cas3' [uncultured Selenomonas sp.]|uniref:CRISPR-associated helicase Cas3' n=1 Tax=uncultured Selenomonas sp. TaxID=159275 RepID=UPI0028DC4E07|nr:CRISPR-associated helicase Cas3' [uncultured Selenomonas sp.]